MAISFRQLTPDDVQQGADIIVRVYAEAPWNEDWSVENAAARLNELATTPGCLAIGAFDGADFIGFAIAIPHTSVTGRGLYIAEIAILPQHQRKGIGTGLLERLEVWARDAGFFHVWLVSRRTGGVSAYYGRNGYEQSRTLGVYTKQLE
jgi:GNAT superfamily N-acetyltransferase